MSLVLDGVVTDRGGSPVANARVVLAAGPVSLPDIAALTDEGGHFSFSVPVAGLYQVAAYADDVTTVAVVDISASRPAVVHLVLEFEAR